MQTPWPTVWPRPLQSHLAVSRGNALAASRRLAERRAEREEVERFLAEAYDTAPSPRTG